MPQGIDDLEKYDDRQSLFIMSVKTGSLSSEKGAASKGTVFLKRLGSTLFLWGILVFGVFAEDPRISLCSAGVSLLFLAWGAYWEYLRMTGAIAWTFAAYSTTALGSLYLVYCLLEGTPWFSGVPSIPHQWWIGFLWSWCCYLCFHYRHAQDRLGTLSRYAFGWGYIFLMMGCLIGVFRFGGELGKWYLLLMVLCTKFSDMGAYVVGSLIGRHKMIPQISPGKTWEGFAGAILFSMVFGWALTRWASDHLGHLSSLQVWILAAVLSVGAVVGDLVESILKRECGVKDSGRFLPGIGGALDLVDSLLFNAPIMILYLYVFQHTQA